MARRTVHVVLALLPALVSAFSNTHPIVAWSSHSSNTLYAGSLEKPTHSSTILETILSKYDVCFNDAIILVAQEGLHASDLRTLSPSGVLAQTLNIAESTLELPYVPRSTSHPFTPLANAVAERCGARVVSYSPGQTEVTGNAGEKHVVCVDMPAVSGQGTDRKNAMTGHESALASSLDTLSAAFPRHLVVYAGWSPSLHPRQSPSPFSPSSAGVNTTSASASAFAAPTGGILSRYQLLTPGLILSLLVGFFVLIPTVMLGVSAVSSIKSPLQGEPPKGYISAEKKNQ
ncbi:hypothetical protein POSPLADRAFT_1040663 [Postia placenta MAD-698-R-SB12]|uniref:Protein BIG1 n=1 Tax=Postia placenta MAD-698-R-SB12 TaxID=670580 RepID=A0A1X6MW65_9APHY|nr:hypothetical protein POSPLADRAFT_1040663 [Postia placenta MAD-698-R-SB12]OSX60614.1 hypothetical protein POSPLADRAFT_1040663 [Postia placenta MAD-698-R-SB12]